VFDAAVEKAYGGKRKIAWLEVYAGEKAFKKTGSGCPTRPSTRSASYLVGIKGPLTTPVGGGIRSAQRRAAPDPRPLRLPAPGALLRGRAEPGQAPELTDMVIFRENTEDIYAGIEFQAGTPECDAL
jgi:isocitrate dehydrogenase